MNYFRNNLDFFFEEGVTKEKNSYLGEYAKGFKEE